jgi:hypothetical protein
MVKAQASKRTIHYSESRCGSSNKHSFSLMNKKKTFAQTNNFGKQKVMFFEMQNYKFNAFLKLDLYSYDASYKNSSSTLL